MSQFFIEYGLFLLKVVTIVVAIVIVIGVAAAAGRKASKEGLEVESINKRYKLLASALRQSLLKKGDRRKDAKEEKKREKYPSLQDAWEKYQIVLKTIGDA